MVRQPRPSHYAPFRGRNDCGIHQGNKAPDKIYEEEFIARPGYGPRRLKIVTVRTTPLPGGIPFYGIASTVLPGSRGACRGIATAVARARDNGKAGRYDVV